jgi:hypothetical protein
MSAVDVHPARSALEQSPKSQTSPQPVPAQSQQAAPQWIKDLMDAAVAGETEFRMEMRSQLKNGRGQELIAVIEAMLASTDDREESKKTMIELLENVKQWVAHPEDLEDGGRFFHHHHCGYGGMFGGAFGGYYPSILPGGCYPSYPYYGGCYPYYGGWGGCYGGGIYY